MLEKKQNEISVTKLRAILLLEAEFNAANKIIFNTRLILILEHRNEIPHEIIGGHQLQSVIHIALNKKLINDITNQAKLLHAIISTDASNYFDRVTHPISALTCKHFGLPQDYIDTFFTIIQDIQMYLLTAYGLSE